LLSTYEQFAKRKSEERQSHFKEKRGAKPKACEVTINIGMMEYVGTELKPVRGGSLPLKTSDNAIYQESINLSLCGEKKVKHSTDDFL
jgi:hypothetical protein